MYFSRKEKRRGEERKRVLLFLRAPKEGWEGKAQKKVKKG